MTLEQGTNPFVLTREAFFAVNSANTSKVDVYLDGGAFTIKTPLVVSNPKLVSLSLWKLQRPKIPQSHSECTFPFGREVRIWFLRF